MRKFIFIFAVIATIGLGAASCSHNQKNQDTSQVEEEGIGCLCCPVEEARDEVSTIDQ